MDLTNTVYIAHWFQFINLNLLWFTKTYLLLLVVSSMLILVLSFSEPFFHYCFKLVKISYVSSWSTTILPVVCILSLDTLIPCVLSSIHQFRQYISSVQVTIFFYPLCKHLLGSIRYISFSQGVHNTKTQSLNFIYRGMYKVQLERSKLFHL